MNYDELNFYEFQKFMHFPSAKEVTSFIFNGMAGKKPTITEKDIHGAIEYGIANWKSNIEQCESLTFEQKKAKKDQCETTFRCLESMIIDFLKCNQ